MPGTHRGHLNNTSKVWQELDMVSPGLRWVGDRWLPCDLTMWTSPGCRGDIGSDLTARLGLRLCLELGGLLVDMDS